MIEHILGQAENASHRKVVGYPSLIFRILTALKPYLVNPTHIYGPPVENMHINHKLYEGHHLKDVPLGKNTRKMKMKVLETILESEPATAPKVQSFSTVLTKYEILDRTIQSHESIIGHL